MAPKAQHQIETFPSVSSTDGNVGLEIDSRHNSVGGIVANTGIHMDNHSPNLSYLSDFLKDFRYRMCNHVDSYYLNELYMNKCIKEFQDLYESDTRKIHIYNDASQQKQQQQCQSSSWWRHLLAGGVAGAASRTCTAPLDRLKVTLMVHGSRANGLKLTSALKQMIEEGGARSLWRGNGMNVVKVMPEMALKFMAYDQIKNYLKCYSGKEDLGVLERMAAGSLAGILSQSAIYPLEVIKTRLVLRKSGQSIWTCIQEILSGTSGDFSGLIRAFYRGYIPNLIGIVPYAGIDLAIYETLKREYMSRQSTQKEPTAVVLLTCGVVSSSCGQLVSYPLNLVRTRLQALPVALNTEAATMVGTFRMILQVDGMTGLYRGLAANLMKVAPSVAISYVIYENARVALGAKMT